MKKESGSSLTEASLLMKGKLTETSSGRFNLEDNPADGFPASSGSEFPSGGESSRIDFLKDDKTEMTWGRRIALSLINSKWYNPRAGEDETEDPVMESPVHSIKSEDDLFERTSAGKPNLAKGWAYFEHVSLDRYILEEKSYQEKKNICRRVLRKFQKGNKKMEKAEPGESDVRTRLYPPIFTPHAQLGDFGLGIGLYFSTLRALAFVTFILGMVSVYNIHYFASDAYMPLEFRQQITNKLTIGSAICTNTPWVPCPECNCANVDDDGRVPNQNELQRNRCGKIESLDMIVALKNDCDATPRQLGLVNYVTVFMLLAATALLGEYLRRQEVAFDEDEQTAQDYSVRVTNPPPDATDPEEWRRFFLENCDGAQVTVCTVAVDNDLLVRTLVERRETLRKLENILEPGTSISHLRLACIAAEVERERNWFGRGMARFFPGMPELFARFVALNAKVQGLAQLDFPVTNVFLTFETEKDQRHVLTKLSVGSLKSSRNEKRALSDPKYLFRGEYVLAVEEPDEPSTIRWQDLNAGFLQKVKEQCLTAFATLCAIVAVAVIVRVANDATVAGAAFAIAIFNSIFPMFAKMLTELEAHATEGEKQTSLYSKIALFRWVNTAIVITIITPFTDTLADQNGLIPQIYALFLAEIVTVSAIQIGDPMGHLNRHVLAPRAVTQDAMNLMFSGQPFELAERYTDMTKILFLCVWYCSIFPGSFFLCSFSLLIKYFVDRFSLMRTWKRPPQLGTRVSKFSRRYFFSLACVAMAIISSYYWSGFPYDNLCELDDPLVGYEGSWPVEAFDNAIRMNATNATFTDSQAQYRFCNQDLIKGQGQSFPFVASNQPGGDEWMTPDQEDVTTIFGWTSVIITAIVAIKFVWGWIEMAQGLFRGTFSAVGEDQNIPFSQVTSRNAYIPQVHSPLFSYPLLACDSDEIDKELYEWNDPDRDFSFYDLTKDAKKLLTGMKVSENVGFTKVRHWAPKVD